MKFIGLQVLILILISTIFLSDPISSQSTTNQVQEQFIDSYQFEGTNSLPTTVVSGIRFDIAAGSDFDTIWLSSEVIVGLDQRTNFGSFDLMVEDLEYYQDFTALISNGRDDQFYNAVVLVNEEGSGPGQILNEGFGFDELVESNILNQAPDFIGYSITQIKLNIEHFSYSIEDADTSFSYKVSWEFYGGIKNPNLIEPAISIKYVMVTSDKLEGFHTTNSSVGFSLLFSNENIQTEVPKQNNPALQSGDKGIYIFTILDDEIETLNAYLNGFPDYNIDLRISTTLESGNAYSTIKTGVGFKSLRHSGPLNSKFNTIILEVLYLNIEILSTTINVDYILGWYFTAIEPEDQSSNSEFTDLSITESDIQNNQTGALEASLELSSIAIWSIAVTLGISIITVIYIIIRKLYF